MIQQIENCHTDRNGQDSLPGNQYIVRIDPIIDKTRYLHDQNITTRVKQLDIPRRSIPDPFREIRNRDHKHGFWNSKQCKSETINKETKGVMRSICSSFHLQY